MKRYFEDSSRGLGITLTIKQIGDIVYENDNLTMAAIQSKKMSDLTLLRKGNAHIAVYYIGNPIGNKYGHSGCIGCVCRPDTVYLSDHVSRMDWAPNGGNVNNKHIMIAKTKRNDRQGRVIRFI